ncbi:MAG: helix-turn-helix domain-containing protein [Deltaproteobacteria bacterium]|nr:helix-turn-helix domain-containing protein [Deltaproteobacteria bacterium]
MDDHPDRLLDVHEAATLLGLKASTLYQWAYERRVPVVKPSGPRGPVRFRMSTLMKLIDSWERPALRPPSERPGVRGGSRGT